YCLHVTLRCRLHALAPGLTPRSVFDKFAAVQMIDVHIPTTDGRELLLERYTEPEKDLKLLLGELKLTLPEQPPPKITASAPIAEAEQCPDQHGSGLRRGQHRLRLDAARELLAQPLNRIRGARSSTAMAAVA